MATFRVDDVEPVTGALPTVRLSGLYPEALLIGGDPDRALLEPDGVDPLLSAVARAFAEHRPLVLSPDAVWLTIARGVAQHVRLHAERLRPMLVGHPGRKRLTVPVGGPLPVDAASWQHLAEQFGKLLAAEVTDADLFECDFSTSTDVERMAGRIVLLDAYSPYFSQWAVCVCGIPSITLTGTVEDWRRIRARVDRLAAFDLDGWCRSLAPIADQFVRAAGGDVDRAFWRRIYNPGDAYGGEVATGWAARFYPYLDRLGVLDHPNPLLELPLDEPRDIAADEGRYHGPGVRTSEVPAILSRAVVEVNDRVGGDNRAVALHGGLVGVVQDGDGALRPVAGWHLAPAPVDIDDVLDRIAAEHDIEPLTHDWYTGTREVVALYRRLGAVSLFGGAWRLVPPELLRVIDYGAADRYDFLMAVFDLPDGRVLGYLVDGRTETTYWAAVRPVAQQNPDGTPAPLERMAEAPAAVPVYGTSLAFLLNAALDSGGDIAHVETERLDAVLARLNS
ncbi:hypothetical protein Cs7R123_13740 [Catellatospora sp. TT07R-123]|uniref:DUF4419 domain-containing protein n=1 Tax=Catellatospora sp. TT07R-123 TaxID=2733863 RepID=UPI001B1A6305|nr:DUF4419 domain-containing protein [Catellatospora sp. TT07R-123]GHJ44032.1 hypothetical protein Cs7R123_13740 [Catellatospora sp. TT07R-123]